MHHTLQLALDCLLRALPFPFATAVCKSGNLNEDNRRTVIRFFVRVAIAQKLDPMTVAHAAQLLDAYAARGGDISRAHADVLVAALIDIAAKVCPYEADDALHLQDVLAMCHRSVTSSKVWAMQGHILGVQKGRLVYPTVFSFIAQIIYHNTGKFFLREIFGAYNLAFDCIFSRADLNTTNLSMALFCVAETCNVAEGWIPEWVPADAVADIKTISKPARNDPVSNPADLARYRGWLQKKLSGMFLEYARRDVSWVGQKRPLE